MKALLRMFTISLLAIGLLTGCESIDSLTKGTDDGSPAGVEDGRATVSGSGESESARTHGLGDSDSLQGARLDDPNSPLSVRVIYFEYDSSDIKPEFRGVIEAHATYLNRNPDTIMTLEGHADERGSREYNLALGERRANAVRRQLVLLGASAGQIRIVSYGEERPVSEDHDEAAYSLNRRVEIIY